MQNLADLLKYDAEGLDVDLAKTVQVYQRAIDKGYVFAMSILADLLKEGVEGLDPDPKRTVQLYERAIETRQGMFSR